MLDKETIKTIIIALILALLIRYFLLQPFFVEGSSMEPNLVSGEYLLIEKISYKIRDPELGEVIVFKHPRDHSQYLIKRVAGLPGETVKIKDGELTLKENQYFVLGDNRDNSTDSRQWGPLPKENIIGRVWFSIKDIKNIIKALLKTESAFF